MFCPNCGTENKDTARFCKNCGQTLAGAELQRGRAAPITGQRKPSTIPLAFTVGLITLAAVYIYISLGGPLPSSLTREVPVTRIVTKEVVVERPITPICPAPEVIEKEIIVEKEVPVTVEVMKQVIVEKEVPVTVVVEKEVVVKEKVIETVVVEKEVVVEVVVTATPVPPAP